MHLVIDIGNTRAKYALFDHQDNLVLRNVVLKHHAASVLKKVIPKYPVTAAIITGTSEIDDFLIRNLQEISVFIHMDSNTKTPVKNLYLTPSLLGRDRLAAAVGAYKRFAGQSVLIIDMGTCITMNYLTSSGEFIGGNISPGIKMRLKAMHKFTARLPLVEIEIPAEDFGRNTVRALQNGAVKGAFREIDSFIDEIRIKYGLINIILTGGDAEMFESYTKNMIFVAPNLVLEGLNEILKYNVK